MGLFMCNAARRPEAPLRLGHLMGDIPALLLIVLVLAVPVRSAGLRRTVEDVSNQVLLRRWLLPREREVPPARA